MSVKPAFLAADSVTSTVIPVGKFPMVMGYLNGRYAWSPADWAHHPNTRHVTIDVIGNRVDADVLDIESEDATNATAVVWIRTKLARKDPYLPVLYTSRSNLTPLFNDLESAGFHPGVHFRTGIADWNGNDADPAVNVPDLTGVTYIQYKDSRMVGVNYDLCAVYDGLWKAPPPTPVPPPTVTRHGMVVSFWGSNACFPVTTTDDGLTWHRS